MPTTNRNRLRCAVSAVAAAGLGAFTISTAASGFRTFGAADDGLTFDVWILEGTAWEVRRVCTYTHSGTSLARGTFEDSSTGSPIAFTTAAVVAQAPGAYFGDSLETTLQSLIPGGRLTLTTGVPVTTADVTAATNIYYTPYLHNAITLWDGVEWRPVVFAETTEALGTLTSGLPYDVFGFLASGVLDLEKLAWTNDTTRATAVTLQDGRYCKSGDKTRLYLGTFRTTSTTTTEDSGGGSTTQVGGKRFLWNMYNREPRFLSVIDTTDSWSYTTDTIRQANAAAGNKVEFLIGMAGQSVQTTVVSTVSLSGNASRGAKVGVGVNSTTAFSGLRSIGFTTSAAFNQVGGSCVVAPAVGYHYHAWCEKGADNVSTFFGDGGADGTQCGMVSMVEA